MLGFDHESLRSLHFVQRSGMPIGPCWYDLERLFQVHTQIVVDHDVDSKRVTEVGLEKEMAHHGVLNCDWICDTCNCIERFPTHPIELVLNVGECE